MQLDRNLNPRGFGKYALILMRGLSDHCREKITRRQKDAFIAVPGESIDPGEDKPFFVIRLNDKFAEPALRAYAAAVSDEALELTREAGKKQNPSERTRLLEEAEGLREFAREIDAEADEAEVIRIAGKASNPT